MALRSAVLGFVDNELTGLVPAPGIVPIAMLVPALDSSATPASTAAQPILLCLICPVITALLSARDRLTAIVPWDRAGHIRDASQACGVNYGTDRRLVVHGRDARWSRDGRTIVYTGPDGGVFTAPGSGGSGHMLGRGYLADWSADSSKIIYTRMGDTAAQDSIWIMNRNGSNPHRIMTGAANPAWRS
jgi:hypothetical protein